MGELEGRLLDARAQIDNLLRDLRSGFPAGSVQVKLLGLASELIAYVLEAAAERVKGR